MRHTAGPVLRWFFLSQLTALVISLSVSRLSEDVRASTSSFRVSRRLTTGGASEKVTADARGTLSWLAG